LTSVTQDVPLIGINCSATMSYQQGGGGAPALAGLNQGIQILARMELLHTGGEIINLQQHVP
jgi:hypothetical protein